MPPTPLNSLQKRSYLHPSFRERAAQLADKGHRRGIVAMHAQALHAPFGDKSFRLFGRLARIRHERIGFRARHKRSIGPVTPVGKPLANKANAAATEFFQL